MSVVVLNNFVFNQMVLFWKSFERSSPILLAPLSPSSSSTTFISFPAFVPGKGHVLCVRWWMAWRR